MDYKQTTKEARLKVLELIYKAQTSHIGSNLSVIDILAVIFNRKSPSDKVILSAGWKACAFYYFLYKDNQLTESELNTYCQPKSKLIGLTEPMKGIEFAGGSMGLGLPAAVGFALAKKIKNEQGKVYCIMSDGEMDCGTTWEALEIAHHHNLDNLLVIVDNNGFQAMGKKDDILKHSQNYRHIDGHNHKEIEDILESHGLVLADTIKGKGIDFMENNNKWHYLNIDDESYRQAKDILSRTN
jgi:transketolase